MQGEYVDESEKDAAALKVLSFVFFSVDGFSIPSFSYQNMH